MEKDKIELKAVMEPAEVAEYLAALARGFKAGRIVVEKDGESLELHPEVGARAEVEVEARIKRDKAKFSLELSWQIATGETASLRIGTGEAKAQAEKQPVAKEAKPAEKPAEKFVDKSAKPAAVAPKSDVKPAAPAVNEPGGKAAVAASAPAKPKP